MSERFLGGIEKIGSLAVVLGLIVWVPTFVETYAAKRDLEEHRPENFLRVHSVSVGNAIEGENVPIRADAEILQDFWATYTVQVRTFPARATVCTASDRVPYHSGGSYPETVTLEWWADDGECSGRALIPGEYVIVTSWTIENDHHEIPPQTITVDSNPFVVRPRRATPPPEAMEMQRSLQGQIETLQQEIYELKGQLQR